MTIFSNYFKKDIHMTLMCYYFNALSACFFKIQSWYRFNCCQLPTWFVFYRGQVHQLVDLTRTRSEGGGELVGVW